MTKAPAVVRDAASSDLGALLPLVRSFYALFGYPLPQAAHVALKAMTDFLRDHPGMRLRMICHNPDALRAYQVDWNMFYQDVKPHA